MNKQGKNKTVSGEHEEMTPKDIKKIDDDFLSGDNKKKMMSPGGSNPNIGGNENEYEDSTPEENLYDEEALGNENPNTTQNEPQEDNPGRRNDTDSNQFL